MKNRRNLFQMRQKIFAALEEKMSPDAEIEAEANALIAALQDKRSPESELNKDANKLSILFKIRWSIRQEPEEK